MHETKSYEMPLVVSGFLILIGALFLTANLDPGVIRQILAVIWPLCLIASGVYGILLHNWRQHERQS